MATSALGSSGTNPPIGNGESIKPSRWVREHVRDLVRLGSQIKALYAETDKLMKELVDSGRIGHGETVFVDREHGEYRFVDIVQEAKDKGNDHVWKSTKTAFHKLEAVKK